MQRPNEIVMGKIAAETYKVGVGDTITLNDNRYKIVGITETGVAYEDGGGMLALREAQRLMGRPRAVTFIFVDASSGRRRRGGVDVDRRFPEAQASLSSEFAEHRTTWRRSPGHNGILALFIGGIVVANTMMMSIYERTRRSARSRARLAGAGHPEPDLAGEPAPVPGRGGARIRAGGRHALGISKIPMADAMITASWDLRRFVDAIAVALGVGLIAGFYPAWRASRLQPVEALRYE